MHWLAVHFYPLETPDLFLSRAVKPFLEQYIWPTKGARAFFVRYEDHIRLRMKGEAAWVDETLREAVAGWFAERGAQQAGVYEPEVERYGGAELLPWAEEHFHISTRVVLDRLAQPVRTYGDTLFDAMRSHVMALFAAGLDRQQAARYCAQLSEQWLPVFFRPLEGTFNEDLAQGVREQFEARLARQREDLEPVLDALWKALEAGEFDKKQPEWLRWFRGNELVFQAYGERLPHVLPSLLHLHNNRIGVHNQDEVFLFYALGRTL